MKNMCTEISWLLDDALQLFRKRALSLLLWPLMGSFILHLYQNIANSLDFRNYVEAHSLVAVVTVLVMFLVAIFFFNASFIQITSLMNNNWISYRSALMGSVKKQTHFLSCLLLFLIWHLLLIFVVSLFCGALFYVMGLLGLSVSTNPPVVVFLSMIFAAYVLYVLVRSFMLGYFVMQSQLSAYQTFVSYLQFSAGSYRWLMILVMVMMAHVLQTILVGWPVAIGITLEYSFLGKICSFFIQIISGGFGWTLILIAISRLAIQWQKEQLLA